MNDVGLEMPTLEDEGTLPRGCHLGPAYQAAPLCNTTLATEDKTRDHYIAGGLQLAIAAPETQLHVDCPSRLGKH